MTKQITQARISTSKPASAFAVRSQPEGVEHSELPGLFF